MLCCISKQQSNKATQRKRMKPTGRCVAMTDAKALLQPVCNLFHVCEREMLRTQPVRANQSNRTTCVQTGGLFSLEATTSPLSGCDTRLSVHHDYLWIYKQFTTAASWLFPPLRVMETVPHHVYKLQSTSVSPDSRLHAKREVCNLPKNVPTLSLLDVMSSYSTASMFHKRSICSSAGALII